MREWTRAAWGLPGAGADRDLVSACEALAPIRRYRGESLAPVSEENVDLALHIYLRRHAPVALDPAGRLDTVRFIAYLSDCLDEPVESVRQTVEQSLRDVAFDADRRGIRLNHFTIPTQASLATVHDVFCGRAPAGRVADLLSWRDAAGENVLHLLVRHGRRELIPMLREAIPPAHFTALLHTSEGARTSAFECLLRSGQDCLTNALVSSQDVFCEPFIDWLVHLSPERIDVTLRQAAARLFRWQRNATGGNVFHFVTTSDHHATFLAWLTPVPSRELRALDRLATLAGAPCTQELLASPDVNGYSPLGLAAIARRTGQLHRIVEHGWFPASSPYAVDMAACHHASEVQACLRRHPGTPPGPVHPAMSQHLKELAQLCSDQQHPGMQAYLREALSRLHTRTGGTVLHACAACVMDPDALDRLVNILGVKAMVDMLFRTDSQGRMALQIAGIHGNHCLLRWLYADPRITDAALLQRCTDRITRDPHGPVFAFVKASMERTGPQGTILHVLAGLPFSEIRSRCVGRYIGPHAFAHLLREHDAEQRPALECVIHNGNFAFLEWLLSAGAHLAAPDAQVLMNERAIPELIVRLVNADAVTRQAVRELLDHLPLPEGSNVFHMAAMYVKDNPAALHALCDTLSSSRVEALLHQTDTQGGTPAELAIASANATFLQWVAQRWVPAGKVGAAGRALQALAEASAALRWTSRRSDDGPSLPDAMNVLHLVAMSVTQSTALSVLSTVLPASRVTALSQRADAKGRTPVELAIETQNTAFLRWLIWQQSGALAAAPWIGRAMSDSLCLTDGTNVLHLAATSVKKIQTLRFLSRVLSPARVKELLLRADGKGRSALELAIETANVGFVLWVAAGSGLETEADRQRLHDEVQALGRSGARTERLIAGHLQRLGQIQGRAHGRARTQLRRLFATLAALDVCNVFDIAAGCALTVATLDSLRELLGQPLSSVLLCRQDATGRTPVERAIAGQNHEFVRWVLFARCGYATVAHRRSIELVVERLRQTYVMVEERRSPDGVTHQRLRARAERMRDIDELGRADDGSAFQGNLLHMAARHLRYREDEPVLDLVYALCGDMFVPLLLLETDPAGLMPLEVAMREGNTAFASWVILQACNRDSMAMRLSLYSDIFPEYSRVLMHARVKGHDARLTGRRNGNQELQPDLEAVVVDEFARQMLDGITTDGYRVFDIAVRAEQIWAEDTLRPTGEDLSGALVPPPARLPMLHPADEALPPRVALAANRPDPRARTVAAFRLGEAERASIIARAVSAQSRSGS